MTQRVRIRRIRRLATVALPAYETDGAAAFDLAAAEESSSSRARSRWCRPDW